MQDESELIKIAKKGDISAFESIFHIYAAESVRLAYIITKDWALSEDAVQEAFLRAFKSLKNFDDTKPFKPWITKIVVNQAIKIKKKWFGLFPLIEYLNIDEKESSPEQKAESHQTQQDLIASIYKLDQKYRLPLVLKYYEGFSETELSLILKLPVSTVKSRLYTARQRLEKIIKDLDGDINE